MRKKHLLASGLPNLAVLNIGGDSGSGLTATGSTQSDALLLAKDVNEFTTVASGTGCRFNSETEAGDSYIVYNGGANALSVYPPSGGSINALSADAAFSLAANKLAVFVKVSGTRWASNLTA